MKKTITAIAMFTVSSITSAHHSAAVFYHMDQEVTMSGKVTEFRMGNPHMRVYFDVTDENGNTVQWMGEGGSRTVLLRHGWTGDEVQVGDMITVYGNPSREGKNIVHVKDIVFANGEKRFAEDLNPDDASRLLEERRRRD